MDPIVLATVSFLVTGFVSFALFALFISGKDLPREASGLLTPLMIPAAWFADRAFPSFNGWLMVGTAAYAVFAATYAAVSIVRHQRARKPNGVSSF